MFLFCPSSIHNSTFLLKPFHRQPSPTPGPPNGVVRLRGVKHFLGFLTICYVLGRHVRIHAFLVGCMQSMPYHTWTLEIYLTPSFKVVHSALTSNIKSSCSALLPPLTSHAGYT